MSGRQDPPALGICSVLNGDVAELWELRGQEESHALSGRRRTESVPGGQPAKARQGHELPCHKLSSAYCSGHKGPSLGRGSDQESRPIRGLQLEAGSGMMLYAICSLDP